jgi:hypothetical protein
MRVKNTTVSAMYPMSSMLYVLSVRRTAYRDSRSARRPHQIPRGLITNHKTNRYTKLSHHISGHENR